MKIVFVVGLPGSGKTTWANQHVGNNVLVDDPLSWVEVEKGFTLALERQHDLWIVDPHLCNPQTYQRAQELLQALGVSYQATVLFETIYFANDLSSCLVNIRGRQGEKTTSKHDARLMALSYAPKGQVLSVYQVSGEQMLTSIVSA